MQGQHMNDRASANIRSWIEHPLFITGVAAAIYCVYYFVLCKMSIIGTPTFRIDYFATTIRRADDSLSTSLLHARPASELYIYLQAIVAKNLLHGQSKYIIYPFQHISLLIYFFCVSKIIASIFKIKLHPLMFIMAWMLFMTNPGVIGNVYKLETIVGTLSMLFGGFALLSLEKWERDGKTSSAATFIALFCLSIFSKEDFLLPPVLLFGWHVITDKDWKYQLKKHRVMLVCVFLVLAFFLVFNKFLIPGRSYMDPIERRNSPYFMTLNPMSMIRVLAYYTVGIGLHIKLLTLIFLALSLAAIVLRNHWKQAVFVGLIVGSLMAPYLIMPNHLFPYYGLNWWVWETLASLALLQVIFTRAGLFIAAAASLAVLAPNLDGLVRQHSTNWNQSNYLRINFAIADNVQKFLRAHRDEINRYKAVAVIGIGPGQIEQSPWQKNGETAFYLKDDFGLTPRWVLFVNSSNAAYRIDQGVGDATSAVSVRSISTIDAYRDIPKLVFNPDGTGRLILPAPSTETSTSEGTNPSATGHDGVLRYISAADNYPYLHGFDESEGVNGRWLSADNEVLLTPEAGDHFQLVAYTPPADKYLHDHTPNVTVSFDGCVASTQATMPDTLAPLEFPIPATCHLGAGKPVTVRIQVDNLLDAAKTGDSRPLGVLGKDLGFVSAGR